MKPASSAYRPDTPAAIESPRADTRPPVPSVADAATLIAHLSAIGGTRRIMLLQGPVGPFFADLHTQLLRGGFAVERIVFNPADRLFLRKGQVTRITGGANVWQDWLRESLAVSPPEAIILFGSNRPPHACARAVAAEYGITVISLEEGYLRSGYITCEIGGNNQHSPFAQWRFRRHLQIVPPARSQPLPAVRSSILTMSLWGAIHYLVRDLLSKHTDEALFHRGKDRITTLTGRWCAHAARRLVARGVELPARRRVQATKDYILVPLQVPTDSQLLVAARGWTSAALIEACLQALVRADAPQRLVFKLHPLDTSGARMRRVILQRLDELKIGRDQVQVLETGRMADLVRHATGMVVINSTSAFSALHHNVPVLVLGEAVYRHDTVVTIGETPQDIGAFFRTRQTKPRPLIDAFLADLKAESLLAGDFYIASGRKVAAAGIIAKLDQLRSADHGGPCA
ncbi:capsular polysaccharide export protein, LipB/KpsS family [Yoonia vestfoldensis]|uniref:capsular polysaccharide export protein, LipB/KpsS family n=1 Tax=Yoonia vestfoldensis TaxID=245188 RepID=UPI0013A5569E|nr:hypothetical protein [Yoonia vestfoldensis]